MTKLLIDGSNMWFRAFYSTMLDPPGGPVMIMTYMLRRFCDRYGKDNVIVCWDGGHGGRKALDPNYKAQREAKPEIWAALPFMQRMIQAIGVQSARMEGYEADDVAGSLAQQGPAVILSYDKDFYQLVSDSISVLRPERTVAGKRYEEQMVDRDIVLEDYGCPPEKVVLVKSFRGDASDNIPKAPVRFTKKFKGQFYDAIMASENVEHFYSNLEVFDPKYQLDLLQFKKRALLNEALVKIKTDLDVEIAKPSLNYSDFRELCQEIEITKLKFADWEIMPDEAPPPPPTQGTLF